MKVLRGKKFIFIVALLLSSIILLEIILPPRSSATRKVTIRNYFGLLTNLRNFSVISPTSSNRKRSAITWASLNFSAQVKTELEYVKSFKDQETESIKVPFQINSSGQLKPISRAGSCELPPGGYKSWSRGVVTMLTPDRIHANCTSLFRGDELEVKRVQIASFLHHVNQHTLKFMERTKTANCTYFQEELEDNLYITKDEVAFPMAFTLIVHNSPFQIFRLLKVIYRPHNIYCIHYDSKSSQDKKLVFNNLAMCFDNIIIPSNIISVWWGHHSLMDAQMNCFRDLLGNHGKYPWHYVITLCGKELPLRTNSEIVHLLKDLNGMSAVRAHPIRIPQLDRLKFHNGHGEEAGPVPFNLTIYKSMVYFALTPEFVDYVLNDKVAIALFKFLKDAYIPEEYFYSTLFMIPGKPSFRVSSSTFCCGWNVASQFNAGIQTIKPFISI